MSLLFCQAGVLCLMNCDQENTQVRPLGKDGAKSPRGFELSPGVGQDARRVGHKRSGQRDVLMRFNAYINPSSTQHVFSLLMSLPCQDIILEVIKGCWLWFNTVFYSKDEEITSFPWAAATWFCFGVEIHILMDKRKTIWILLKLRWIQSHRRAL